MRNSLRLEEAAARCRSRDPGYLTLNGPVCAKRVCGTRVDRLKRGGWCMNLLITGELTPRPPAEAPIAMPLDT